MSPYSTNAKQLETGPSGAGLIARVLVDAKMKPLEDFIDGFASEFGALRQALRINGFAESATGPARDLWDVFVKVAETIHPANSAEPWMLIRDLARHLNDNVEDAEAATALMTGLIHHGETAALATATLGALRDDLRRIKPRQHPGPSRPIKTPRKRTRKVWLAGVALMGLCASALYLGFEEAHWSWLKDLADPALGSSATEIEPPVGTGQHFSLGNVRYCHFQEERLRILKDKVRAAEDTRAFNMLVVDYNSRCSDFLYQDSDLATVAAEIAANRPRLADEAERMISRWRGHTSVPVFAPPAK
jgi:hypothetical protein